MTVPWMVAFGALCAVVVGLGAVVLGLLRRLDFVLSEAQKTLIAVTAQLRGDGLRPGEFVGPFAVTTADEQPFSRYDLLGRSSLVLFVSSGCSACAQLIAETGNVPAFASRLIVVARDADEAVRWLPVAGALVVIDPKALMAEAFKSHRTPHAFILDETARAAAVGSPNTWDDLSELVASSQKGGGTELESAVELGSAAAVAS